MSLDFWQLYKRAFQSFEQRTERFARLIGLWTVALEFGAPAPRNFNFQRMNAVFRRAVMVGGVDIGDLAVDYP